jgi:hypothetical protein
MALMAALRSVASASAISVRRGSAASGTRFSASRICSTKRLASREAGTPASRRARPAARRRRPALERDLDGALVQRRIVGLAGRIQDQRITGRGSSPRAFSSPSSSW